MNVLLVDDEPVVLKSVGDFLTRSGHGVCTALCGQEALQQLQEVAIDVVISDLRMDGMNGFELLAAVEAEYPGVPVVLITGYGDLQVAKKALAKGAFDYLQKPLQLDVLLEVLDRINRSPNTAQTLNRLVQTCPEDDLGIAVRRYLEGIQAHWKQLMPTLDVLSASSDSKDVAACVSAIDHLMACALRDTECLAKFGDLPLQSHDAPCVCKDTPVSP